jgi:predicted TPR repeat methyltransferase
MLTQYIAPEALIDELNEVVDRHNTMAADFLRCLSLSARQLALWHKKAEQFDALLEESNRLLHLAQNAQAWRDENEHLWQVLAALDAELRHYETLTTAPTDFAALWRLYKAQDEYGRSDPATDLAFWAAHAANYDASHHHCPETVKTLLQLRRAGDTVLDVGAGTGRFVLALAPHVRQVTALDHSAAMLAVLRRKIEQQQVPNISLVEAAWEEAEIEPHDLVFAAWSLYRQQDLITTVQKLVAATRQTLVIVESDDDAPQYPHYPFLVEMWGEKKRANLSKYLCFLGALWQIGVRTEVKIIYETGCRRGPTPQTIAAQLAPMRATSAQIGELADKLRPWLTRETDAWSYRYTYPVEMLIWHRQGT